MTNRVGPSCRIDIRSVFKIIVNGKGMRTCSRVLHPGERILLEPMKGFPIIRDLVVDFGINITTAEGVFKKMEGTVLRRVKEKRD